MTLAKVAKSVEHFVGENSPAIMTGIGVAGTLVTAYLTGKATIKATDIIREYEHHIEEGRRANILDDLTVKEKVELTWKLYIPPALAATTTISAIVCANRIGARRTAAVAAAYSLSEKAFAEYKEKVLERLGEGKEQEMRDEIAQSRLEKTEGGSQIIIVEGEGDVLCLDTMSGRYFKSSIEKIRKAQNDINEHIYDFMYASLSEFYELIGLDSNAYSDEVGWNPDRPMRLDFSAGMAKDDKPCVVVEYNVAPVRNYHKLG